MTIFALAASGVVPAAAPAWAGPSASASRSAIFRQQLKVLDTRAAEQYSHSADLSSGLDIPGSPSNIRLRTVHYRGKYLEHAKTAAARYGVPKDLFVRLVQQESGWNPAARSRKGALGLAQLMPETARKLDVDPLDPIQSLDGGARYLAEQYQRFRSWKLALAAYNAGPDAVEKYGDVPPYQETRGYVAAILGG